LLFDFAPCLMATVGPWPTLKERRQHRNDRLLSASGPIDPSHGCRAARRDTVAGWGIRIAKPRFLVYQLL